MASDRSKMFQEIGTRLQNSCKGGDPYLRQMRAFIRDVAGDRLPEDTIESWISRAARRLGMPYSRVRNIWRNRARVITAAEFEHARACAFKAKQQEIARLRQRADALEQEIANGG